MIVITPKLTIALWVVKHAHTNENQPCHFNYCDRQIELISMKISNWKILDLFMCI